MMDKMILYIDLIKIFQQKKNLVQTGQEPLRYDAWDAVELFGKRNVLTVPEYCRQSEQVPCAILIRLKKTLR